MLVVKPETARVGEILYFYPEELQLMIVMKNEKGFRYIEPMNPTFDDLGNICTIYVPWESVTEWTISLGTVKEMAEKQMGKRS